jgi:hypothetical protein
MKHFKTIITIFVIVFLLGIVTSSWGALTGSGSITYNNGLYASGDDWANSSSSLSWNVYQLSSGNYEYDYSFILPTNAKNISHVIIQVSKNFTTADMLTGTTPNGSLGDWDGQGNSNLGIPASLHGIKWDASGTSFSWTIVTDRAPTLGNFYAKDGNADGGVYAYSGTSGVFGNNVVVPDTVTPLPAAAWLLGSGLAGLIRIRRKNV